MFMFYKHYLMLWQNFLEGAILTDEEMVVVHGGISVAMTGGSHCGSGCDGGGGSHCGKDCRPAHLEGSITNHK